MPSHAIPAVWQLLLLLLLLPLSQTTSGGRQVPGGDVPEASQAKEEETEKEEPSRLIFDTDSELGSRVALGLLAPVVAGLVMLVLLTLFAERGPHHHTAYAAAAPYQHQHHGESSSSSYSVLRHFDEDATKKFL
ncbi:uncharacterized protein [Panulirus ornatus]|uniref:uncharacterized protein n=1 Tax=Panulirus ornatus TaxID=150431 RepID=UPI003A8B7EBC